MLRYSNERAEFVIVTGGLGPTNNDVTCQSLSDFTGIPLEEQQDVIAGMDRRFNTTRDQLRANLRRQAQVPVRGTYLQTRLGHRCGTRVRYRPASRGRAARSPAGTAAHGPGRPGALSQQAFWHTIARLFVNHSIRGTRPIADRSDAGRTRAVTAWNRRVVAVRGGTR